MKLRFSLSYFVATVVIFLIEVLIATKLKHIGFVRSYLGDVIVVVLIYTFLLSFFAVPKKTRLIVAIFIFSCIIEFAQYFGLADALRLKEGSAARIVVGSSFSWLDIACYATGCLLIWIFVKLKKQHC